MAEVAGLVLSGIPLVIWALGKYSEPFDAYSDYHTSIQTFRTDLILQNRHLPTTLENIGLGPGPSMEELRKCFETKFPDISQELMYIVQQMDQITARLMEKLEVRGAGKPNTLPDRVQWEWRKVKHSLSTKKRNKAVAELRRWNEDLRRSLEKSEVPVEDESRRVQDLKRRFNIQRSNTIRRYISSLHRALDAGLSCACSSPHQATVDLDWQTYDSAKVMTFQVAIAYRTDVSSSLGLSPWRRIYLSTETPTAMIDPNPDLLSPALPTPLPSPGKSPSKSSFFRAKTTRFELPRSFPRTPPPPTPPSSADTSTSDLSQASTAVSSSTITKITKITDLCAAVSTKCEPCHLAGFLEEKDHDRMQRFYVDNHKHNISKIIKAIPLKFLFSNEQSAPKRSVSLPLSAKQRLGIAASVVWAVLHLGNSPWLGDQWDQNQLSIFVEKSPDNGESLSRYPCASHIFPSPSALKQPRTDNLKHYIPNKTVFTLGIVLIELGLNKPFSALRQDADATMPTSLLNDYETALSHLDEVYRLVGDSYGYAAERCIKFSFQGRDVCKDFDFEHFREQFYEAVVAPVQATYLMFPG